MKNKLIVSVMLLMTSFSAFAQTARVTATLVDGSNNNTPVIGAVVNLKSDKNSNKPIANTSGAGGIITFVGVPYGEYTMEVMFMGYDTIKRAVSVNAPAINLSRITMKQGSEQIEAVVKTIQAMRTSQKGDTVSYNAEAFKVSKDATAEGLLSKLPGIRLVDGGVEAQGETVKKVFVDGKEFFGEDVNSAIKNLPAEAISKVEVYNKKSDQSEFTGGDDGEGYKAINIVTHSSMRSGQFGKIYAGFGTDDRYILGGNVNLFNGDSRISLIGLLNNVNQQNFSSEDLLGVTGSSSSRGGMTFGGGGGGGFMVRQQSGVSKVGSFGINYSDKWSEKVNFQGSYFFNTNDNENTNTIEREYYSETNDVRQFDSRTPSTSTNYNHRFNARLDYKIDDNQTLMIRPAISFQNNFSESLALQNNRNYNIITDVMTPLDSIENLNKSHSNGYNVSAFAIYRIKLGKQGRTIAIDGMFNINQNNRNSISASQTQDYTFIPTKDSILNQRILSDVDRQSYRLGATYTEPINTKSQASLQYRFNYNDSPSDQRVYDFSTVTDKYNDFFNPKLTNIYSSYYKTQSVGPGYNYFTAKTQISANVSYQMSTLDGDQSYPVNNTLTKSFNNMVYFAMLNQTFSPNNTLRVFLRSYTENPSVSNLQNVVTVYNPKSATAGNPNLDPSYTHSLYLNYNRSMVTKGRTFMAMFGASMSTDYIADSLVMLTGDQTYVLPNGEILGRNGQFSKPTNLDGYRSFRGMLSYGTPVKFIKSNINFNGSAGYSRTPGIINGGTNISEVYNYAAGIVLSSNISEKLDFTFRYNIGYNIAKNSIQSNNDNKYTNQDASGSLKWVFWKGITVSSSAAYTKYNGITDDFTEDFFLLNASIGKKIFKNQRGEISIMGCDLLNANKSFARNVTDLYIENVTNSVISRYFTLNFTYMLRNFGKKNTNTPDPNSFRNSGSERPPMGGQPMMMRMQ